MKKQEDGFSKQLNQMIFLLQNGIETEEGKREFGYIDYMQMFALSFDQFLVKIQTAFISDEEFLLIKEFIDRYRKREKIVHKAMQDIRLSKMIVDLQKDQNGQYLLDSGHVITDSEKEMIFFYMKKYHIPLNLINFKDTYAYYYPKRSLKQ